MNGSPNTWMDILQIIVIIYLGGASLYLFFFAIAGLLRRPLRKIYPAGYANIAIVFPAFREDQIITDVITQALKQDYPSFRILLIADSLLPETLEKLRSLPITVREVQFDVSTKVKALRESIRHLPPETDIVLVLDADNIMEDGFLGKVNSSFGSSFDIIQFHRTAKNTNTPFALLDAISEEINNHIFRQGHRAAGLSSALIGSAMAFRADVFTKYIPELNAVAGFDKQLELELLRNKKRVEYIPDAYVLDEKVQNAEVFFHQRKRWIYAQLFYFGEDIKRAVFHLIRRGNFDYFNKTIQYSLPPRVMLLGILIVINLASIFIPEETYRLVWLITLAMNLITLLVSVPRKFFTFSSLKAILELPRIFILMCLILFRLKGVNKRFIHTSHTYTGDKTTNP